MLVVINELSRLDPALKVHFVCDRAFERQSRGLMQHARVPVQVSTIPAGKLRRYHGESVWQRLSDIKTIGYNFRDIFKITGGFFMSVWLLLRERPDVVFTKGGFVTLPLGLAAKLTGVPLVIHDSDTRPGLTNAVLGRFADAIATGSPLENYRYDPAKSRYVGVPIDPAFQPLSPQQQRAAKAAIGVIDLEAPLVVVTGGGLGAKSINEAMVEAGEQLIRQGIHVYHITGKHHYETIRRQLPEHPHYQVVPFVYKDMATVLGAGDVVISRGSATFLQELAGLAKPTIIVPAAHLGDQVKNAAVYAAAEAAIVLSDSEIARPGVLAAAIDRILNDADLRDRLSQKLHRFARPQAARDVATMIEAAGPTQQTRSR